MLKTSRKLLTILTLVLSTSPGAPAFAKQLIEQCYEGHAQLSVSENESSLLTMQGRKIAAFSPSKAGVLEYTYEADINTVYFAFLPGQARGSVTLFVTDDAGQTCTLLVTPKAIAGDVFTIVAPRPKYVAQSRRTLPYQQQAKDLLLAMTGSVPDDRLEPIAVNAELPLWRGVRLIFKSRYEDGGFIGESYDLTNVSLEPMQLAEQELYRPGVIAVGISEHALAPGLTTHVYVVRMRKADE